MIEPNDSADPMDRIEAAEPTLPMDSTEPTLPTESTEPRDPMLSSESCDQSDHLEPVRETAMAPMLPCLPHMLPVSGLERRAPRVVTSAVLLRQRSRRLGPYGFEQSDEFGDQRH